MNNYTIQQSSSTSTGVVIMRIGLSLMVGALIVGQGTEGQAIQPKTDDANRPIIRREENSKTFGQYTNPFTGEYEHSSLKFEENVASFYEKLLTEQEPLGKEFAQVLRDNFWNLLIRT